ncbi:Transcriptional regulator containing HTH domain,ArsR family [Halalkaliarchaeum sp. AArc-CO]|uniref:ArsR/SmtB family transcription factor n=1 Tax=unclassified Halalkaliarchaeum TaxID=2678344 RepID=UPI00217E8DF2|nr:MULTISPECIES: metalloregulator ArsR/SmtB family transcription factor [unclassified Halalkaliarchaeum]MDR5674741.1 metalloregulator ArsR/SmtB family transcription factor [Halalkaliarchaeum sp. AArc-GB]UWG51024.1 Transcriptional regulator containing HTH domain,ArsR family [Halalkaliarchaeum sp. AArc-CO]
MTNATVRLKRYLEDEIGDCQPADVDERITELDALETVLDDDRIGKEVAILAALANETRFKLVRLLVAADGELCVCELNAMVDASESAISHALSRLNDTGLVTRRKDGRWRKYRATNVAVAVVTLLDGTATDE